ncbi:MAG: bifunctional UDP-N-acetylglucosamine diphosphorylase/glucosamine-1-phosphate N-acetyltransferase GlmU [Chloroflexi bacterium]|nr:bifunctional UDP-N-acetylglucosamine diphosphorylase/glucosamine-1-phosphate N-acetyltransferase GlmU [Chloroflexota bacterium]
MTEAEPPASSSPSLGVVILAAGQGTRMRSSLPKILHPVAGRPMLGYVTRVAEALGARHTTIVVPAGSDRLREMFPDARFVVQDVPLGTGHAVLQARDALRGGCDRILVLYGDTPLLRQTTASALVQAVERSRVALLTTVLTDPRGYGRILKDASGSVIAVVEDADASEAERAIQEINSGLMAFQAAWLWDRLDKLKPRRKGELYLTDLVRIAADEGQRVTSVQAADPAETLGVNDQSQLAEATAVILARRRQDLFDRGVILVDPATIYIDLDVEVGEGTVVEPNTHLRGTTRVGRRCRLGPNSFIRDSVIADDCTVFFSVLEESELANDVVVGPFSHARPGARLERGVHLGNYAEVKASTIGAGTRIHHFSYVGDASLGAGVNVGAGTVTCNYDGQAKHRTEVGDGAFIGSSSMLVAPLTIGPGARTGAGSVVTRNVPPGTTVVGVPARALPSKGDAGRDQPAGND